MLAACAPPECAKIIRIMSRRPEISIIIPCLNEEEGIAFCISRIDSLIRTSGIDAEVVVVDNASTDRTAEVVREKITDPQNPRPWLRLVPEPVRGYGSAYLRGLESAEGEYFFMADADGTYDFHDIPRFIAKLKEGNDMVVGNRFMTRMKKESMPWLHRYVGNPVLSSIVRLFFGIKIHDIHCGARAMSREAFKKITLYTSGMEFASEMIIKAGKAHLKIAEIPIEYSPRIGTSKLESFGDGWRHLRFILLYSPLVLFMIPGILLFLIGAIGMAALYFSHITVRSIELFVHPMFLGAVILMLGYQLILFGGFAKTYAVTHLGDEDNVIQSLFKYVTIEKAGFIGIALSALSGIIYMYIFVKWLRSGFGSLDEIKNSIVALTFAVLGIQTFFSAFMLSIIGIKEK